MGGRGPEEGPLPHSLGAARECACAVCPIALLPQQGSASLREVAGRQDFSNGLAVSSRQADVGPTSGGLSGLSAPLSANVA